MCGRVGIAIYIMKGEVVRTAHMYNININYMKLESLNIWT